MAVRIYIITPLNMEKPEFDEYAEAILRDAQRKFGHCRLDWVNSELFKDGVVAHVDESLLETYAYTFNKIKDFDFFYLIGEASMQDKYSYYLTKIIEAAGKRIWRCYKKHEYSDCEYNSDKYQTHPKNRFKIVLKN